MISDMFLYDMYIWFTAVFLFLLLKYEYFIGAIEIKIMSLKSPSRFLIKTRMYLGIQTHLFLTRFPSIFIPQYYQKKYAWLKNNIQFQLSNHLKLTLEKYRSIFP